MLLGSFVTAWAASGRQTRGQGHKQSPIFNVALNVRHKEEWKQNKLFVIFLCDLVYCMGFHNFYEFVHN